MGNPLLRQKDSGLSRGKLSSTNIIAESCPGEKAITPSHCIDQQLPLRSCKVIFVGKMNTVPLKSQLSGTSSPERNKGEDWHLVSGWHLLTLCKALFSESSRQIYEVSCIALIGEMNCLRLTEVNWFAQAVQLVRGEPGFLKVWAQGPSHQITESFLKPQILPTPKPA